MSTVARLVGGPAHGKVLAIPDDRHDLVVPECTPPLAAMLAEYDPLEAAYDPHYQLNRVTFTEHRYRRERYLQTIPHPCVPLAGLAHWRHPWLHQDLQPEDPLVTAWILSDPPDREEWFTWDHTWQACPELARWMRWTRPGTPRLFRFPPTRRNRRVLGDPKPQATPVDPRLATRKGQARAAADRAQVLYPGPVGEMMARELRVWADFAFRFTTDTLIDRLIDFLLDPERQVDRQGLPQPE